MGLERVVTAGLIAVAAFVSSACGPDRLATEFVTSGDCADEQSVVRQALDTSRQRVDVNGDGRLDTVAVASAPTAPSPCRAFLGVRMNGGSTYSTHLFPRAVPVPGLRAEVVALPRLANRPGTQIVIDTKAAVDSVLAQMFSFTGDSLQPVDVPGSQDGTFIVTGGGVIYPHGAGCTSDGRMILSRASQTSNGKAYRVNRRTYELRAEPLRLAAPELESATVAVNRLVTRYPEFAGRHWRACEATVPR